MPVRKRTKTEMIDEKNADVLAELVVDPQTHEALRVQILNKLLSGKKEQTFFDTILEENLDVGACPGCGHQNHWLIPETELNQRGIVTSKIDNRVKPFTTVEDCETYQEACAKKKITF